MGIGTADSWSSERIQSCISSLGRLPTKTTLDPSGDIARAEAPAHYDDILPNPGFEVEKGSTALVITDPQNDFLSPDGVAWGVVGESVQANGTVGHLETLIKGAHDAGIPVFISPHYYYPQDHKWQFGGALEKMMHAIGMFDRGNALSVDGFEGSGADWVNPLKPLIQRDDVVVASPHKVYGPDSNDLLLQLRKQKIDKVVRGLRQDRTP